MKFEFSRHVSAADPRDPAPVQWLAPASLRTSRSRDTLVIALASAVLALLGVVAVVVRFGSTPSEATATTLAALPQQVMRAQAPKAPPQNQALQNPALAPSAAAPDAAPQAIVATPISPVVLSRLDPPFTGTTAVSAVSPRTARVSADASAFAPTAIPSVPSVRREEADAARDAPRDEQPRLEPAAPRRQARLNPEPEPAPTAKPAAAPATRTSARATPEDSAAGAPALRKGGEGATWAVYFDQFPDMKAAAAQINALQGKYGPHLGGRSLTYAKAGAGWRMRVSGLTSEAAETICGKVKSAGNACSVGGR